LNTSYKNSCSGKTIWLVLNSQTYGNTSANKMCISVPAFKGASHTASGRYTGGCMSASSITQANTLVNNLYTFYTSATTLYTAQRSGKSILNNNISP